MSFCRFSWLLFIRRSKNSSALSMMNESLSSEYTESFDCQISGSSRTFKSVVMELETRDGSVQSSSVDTECLSPLSTDRSCKRLASHASAGGRTPNLSASWSKLQFSRHFSGKADEYSADFTGSDADLSMYFESLSAGSEARSDDDKEDRTVFSVKSSDTDTRTCSSVSQETSLRLKDGDTVDEFPSSGNQSSQDSCNVR